MLVGFTGHDGKLVAVNPRQVTYVIDRGGKGATIHFADNHLVDVTDAYDSVVSYVGAAIGKSRP